MYLESRVFCTRNFESEVRTSEYGVQTWHPDLVSGLGVKSVLGFQTKESVVCTLESRLGVWSLDLASGVLTWCTHLES